MRVLFDNLGLKATSLGLAVMLWFAIAGEKTSELGLMVPVELQSFPRDMELTGEPVNTIEARLRASTSIIQRLRPGEVAAMIDLAGVGEGEHIEHLTEDSLRVPFGVQVVRLTPSVITLRLESTLQKTLPIHPRLVGTPAPGYEVASMTCSPRDVRVAGPKSRVREVEAAFTEPVSIEGASSTLVDRVNLGLEDPVLRIQASPRVRVTVEIREVHEKRTFESLSVSVRGTPVTVTPSRVAVILTGPASVMRRVSEELVRPFVELGPDVEPRAVLSVGVEIDPSLSGVTVHQIDPAEVTVLPGRE